MMGDRFAGRRALVTGAASGIGLATARRLAAEGARVCGLDVRPSPDAAELLADVRDPAAVESAVALAVERLGGAPEILVQAAGIYRVRALLETGAADWDEVLEVNLRGTFLVARAAVAAGLGSGGRGGSIVNVASVAAFSGGADEPSGAYDASKAGVCALTRQMAVEWGPRGIRANAVAPGVIETPMLRLMDDPVRGHAYLETRVPLRRLGRAEEVAALICFLASDEASYLTGAIVLVDGGLLAR